MTVAPSYDGGATVDAAVASDAAAPMDALIVGDAIAGPIVCGPRTRIDSANQNVQLANATTLANGRYVASWTESTSTGLVIKVRVFDGTTYLDEQSITTSPSGLRALLASDGKGGGYLGYGLSSLNLARAVLAPGAALFGASDTVATAAYGPSGLAGLPSGGAIYLYTANGTDSPASPYVSKYDPSAAMWSAGQLLRDGSSGTYSLNVEPSSGKAVVGWVASSMLYLSTFDGTTWSAPTTARSLLPTGTGVQVGSGSFNTFLDTNGDVRIIYADSTVETGNTIKSLVYHAGSSTFDATPLIIDQNGATAGVAFIDAANRLTVIYSKSSALWMSRQLGAGWSAPTQIAAQASAVAALDPDGNVVLATIISDGYVTKLAADATDPTAWSAHELTNLGANNSASAAIAFDAMKHPVVFASSLVGSYVTLQAVVCP